MEGDDLPVLTFPDQDRRAGQSVDQQPYRHAQEPEGEQRPLHCTQV